MNPSEQITGRDIIVFSVLPWTIETGSNSRNISLVFARNGNRVLYVDPPLDRNTVIKEADNPNTQRKKEVLKGVRPALRPALDRKNIWLFDPTVVLESINWVPDGPVYDILNKLNAQKLAASVSKAANELGFNDTIVFVDSDMLRCCFIMKYLGQKTYIYYSRDYLQGVPYWQKHGKRLEPVHCANADIVVGNSAFLADWARQYNKNSFNIGQGCDTDHFDPAKQLDLPHDMPQNGRPNVLYVGYLTILRLDLQLLIELAERAPTYNFIYVGGLDDAFAKSSLHQYTNVYLLGKKNFNSLPAYMKYADVCINPQIVNEITEGNYPLKIDEYLAMKKPVVATRTKFMETFCNLCHLATGADEWLEALAAALAEIGAEWEAKRRAFALSHSWENNVLEISKAIRQVEGL